MLPSADDIGHSRSIQVLPDSGRAQRQVMPRIFCSEGLRQRYDGHAKRAALVAAAHSYMARIVVVVDEDIDPCNLHDVMSVEDKWRDALE
jgi:hypothetical protein